MRLSHLSTLLALPQSLRQLVLLAATSAPVAVAEQTPYVSSIEYDAGHYGSYPIHQFFTGYELQAPRVNILQQSEQCFARSRTNHTPEYFFLAPRGKVARPTPLILDEDGAVVWALPELLVTYDLKVQRYQGQDVLTYWSGNDQVVGHGDGEYHILDSSYQEIRTVQAGNGLRGDLHEFILLEESNSALLTIYAATRANLTSVGGLEEGEIWDSIFQEVDLENGRVLFEWVPSQHYAFTDTIRQLHGAGIPGDPWDWFHLNSIDKDHLGNYLISARYTHSLTYLDGKTGDIIWILGGERNEFTDLSGGGATNFAGQHDARWHDNYTVITLFDNAADYETHNAEWSRGMRLAVDTTAKTVELITEYIDPGHTLSESQGSLQVLSNDNVLVGWGFNGAFTEFSKDGKVLCDVHFESALAFGSGDVQNYRAYKQPWKGYPKTEPSVAVVGSMMYISWNGATEVKHWLFRTGNDMIDWEKFTEELRVSKVGFETTVNRNRIESRFLRVEGLDADGNMLGSTGNIDLGVWETSLWWKLWNRSAWRSAWFYVPSMMVAGAFMVLFGRKVRQPGQWQHLKSRWQGSGEYEPIPPSWVESEWQELRGDMCRVRSRSRGQHG